MREQRRRLLETIRQKAVSKYDQKLSQLRFWNTTNEEAESLLTKSIGGLPAIEIRDATLTDFNALTIKHLDAFIAVRKFKVSSDVVKLPKIKGKIAAAQAGDRCLLSLAHELRSSDVILDLTAAEAERDAAVAEAVPRLAPRNVPGITNVSVTGHDPMQRQRPARVRQAEPCPQAAGAAALE